MSSDEPALRAAAECARDLSQTNGWHDGTLTLVLDGLAAVLADRPGSRTVPISEVRALSKRRISASRVAEVLARLDLLDNDSEPSICGWIERSAKELPPGFSEPVRHWLWNLHNGGERDRPRSRQTLYRYFAAARPLLAHWAARHGHLREVAHADVVLALDPLRGHRRNIAICALRSLFGFAKKNGLVFANPTRHLKTTMPDFNLLPLDDSEIRAIEKAAAINPAVRLTIALAAEHAARTAAIRNLTLEDIDLPNRRIVLAGHSQRLGEMTRQALLAWLDYRRARWPHSPNRHVLVSGPSAREAGPVTDNYFRTHLAGNGFGVERIRTDRILHEALTASPDPLHLTLVFGITHTTAARYAQIAQNLLQEGLAADCGQ